MHVIQQNENRKARARKANDGQEQIVVLDALKDSLEHLVELLHLAQSAAKDYSDVIKNNAEIAGIQASVLGRFVKAKAGEKFEQHERDARQLVMLFDEAL
jgi:hypothetical protein